MRSKKGLLSFSESDYTCDENGDFFFLFLNASLWPSKDEIKSIAGQFKTMHDWLWQNKPGDICI